MYSKQAQQWHPDNFQSDEVAKKAAEKKFIDIAAAKEVLTDPGKFVRVDSLMNFGHVVCFFLYCNNTCIYLFFIRKKAKIRPRGRPIRS